MVFRYCIRSYLTWKWSSVVHRVSYWSTTADWVPKVCAMFSPSLQWCSYCSFRGQCQLSRRLCTEIWSYFDFLYLEYLWLSLVLKIRIQNLAGRVQEGIMRLTGLYAPEELCRKGRLIVIWESQSWGNSMPGFQVQSWDASTHICYYTRPYNISCLCCDRRLDSFLDRSVNYVVLINLINQDDVWTSIGGFFEITVYMDLSPFLCSTSAALTQRTSFFVLQSLPSRRLFMRGVRTAWELRALAKLTSADFSERLVIYILIGAQTLVILIQL